MWRALAIAVGAAPAAALAVHVVFAQPMTHGATGVPSRSTGTTLLVVTHDRDIAAEADVVIEITDGRIGS